MKATSQKKAQLHSLVTSEVVLLELGAQYGGGRGAGSAHYPVALHNAGDELQARIAQSIVRACSSTQ